MTEQYRQLKRAFASRVRPAHFTNYNHCEECLEHERTLQHRDNESLSFNDVGIITYSPISFINLEGFLYFLPGLARLASAKGEYYFLDTFLIHLDNEERRKSLNADERRALLRYLLYLRGSIFDDIARNLDEESLDELIFWLEKEN
ncbi:hypothetical protein [Pseudoalteromonas sp. bablab_jr011]|uniref:hypothetical protein n=1 Tax=Pseudoalteromonas sp. bablab_jr011 TaxID=2755062 RepID=UPI0018F66FC1|nr:hypothetical protein [Pseudoalteromonas sp. bablab_jr011]